MDIEIEVEEQHKSAQNMGPDGVYIIPYVPQLLTTAASKRKYFIRNGEFCWYFKLVLLMF